MSLSALNGGADETKSTMVSRAGFYRHWQEREPRVEETEVRAQIQQIAIRHRRNYGYRRVTRELRDQGWAINHKRVARILAEDNLLCGGGGASCSPPIPPMICACI